MRNGPREDNDALGMAVNDFVSINDFSTKVRVIINAEKLTYNRLKG